MSDDPADLTTTTTEEPPPETTTEEPPPETTTEEVPPETTTEEVPPETTTEEPPPETTTESPGASTTAEPESTTTAEPDSSTTTDAPGSTTTAEPGSPAFTSVTVTIDPDDGTDRHDHSVQAASDARLTLSWETSDATSVHIEGLGDLDASGSHDLPPFDASYSLIALGKDDAESAPYALDVHVHDKSEVVSQHVEVGAGVAAIVSFDATRDGQSIEEAAAGDQLVLIAVVTAETEEVKIAGQDAELAGSDDGRKRATLTLTLDEDSEHFDCEAFAGGESKDSRTVHISIEPPHAHAALLGFAMGNQSGTPAPASTLRLQIHWGEQSAKNRFVQTMQVKVNAQPSLTDLTPRADSPAGRKDFDIPASETSVVVEVSIRSQTGLLLSAISSYFIDRNASPPALNAGGVQNARLSIGTPPAGAAVVVVEADVAFIDVTAHVLALGPANASAAILQRPWKSRVAILEYTRGKPETWAAVIPPAAALPNRADANLFLCFRNETGNYTNSDDANYGYLDAYLATPADPGLFMTGGVFRNYGALGWDVQLADSRKSVILAFPFPHVIDFGVMNALGPPAIDTLRSFVRCLVGGGIVGASAKSPASIRRLAVGGWSSGTDTLWDWCSLGFKDVDEIFAFDGKKGFPDKVSFPAWIKGKPGRRLKMFGTAYTAEASMNMAQQLQQTLPIATVAARPGSPDFFHDDPDYKRAWADERLRPRSQPAGPAPDVSDLSGIFLAGVIGPPVRGIKLEWTNAKGVKRQAAVSGMAIHEAAGLIRGLLLGRETGGGPVTTAEQFDKIVAGLFNSGDDAEKFRLLKTRHPWSVQGGRWISNKGADVFVGYLQTALESSGFT